MNAQMQTEWIEIFNLSRARFLSSGMREKRARRELRRNARQYYDDVQHTTERRINISIKVKGIVETERTEIPVA